MLKDRIKEVRKSLKLTQTEFGERLGVSRDVIANIEGGRVDPQDIFIDHLCSSLMVNRKWLMRGTGEMFAAKNANISEITSIFEQLNPELQEYALGQFRMLFDLQKKINEEDQ